jgi:hypothetical protein
MPQQKTQSGFKEIIARGLEDVLASAKDELAEISIVDV